MRVDGVCNRTAPSLRTLGNGAQVLCHRSEDLARFQAEPEPVPAGGTTVQPVRLYARRRSFIAPLAPAIDVAHSAAAGGQNGNDTCGAREYAATALLIVIK